MKSLLLKRFTPQSSTKGTLSALSCDDEIICFIGEPPWLDNRPFMSCVPDGLYLNKRYSSPKYPDTFEITGVTGRDHVLYHPGNFLVDGVPEDRDKKADTDACLLPGLQIEIFGEDWSILNSKEGFKKFMDFLKGENSFQLAIKWA